VKTENDLPSRTPSGDNEIAISRSMQSNARHTGEKPAKNRLYFRIVMILMVTGTGE
jgi:hypothetical protein